MTAPATGPQFSYPPQQPGWMPPPPPPKKMGVGKIVGLTLLGLLVIGGIGSAFDGDEPTKIQNVSADVEKVSAEAKAAEARRIAENEAAQKAKEEAEAEALAAAKAAAAVPPKPDDFAIEIMVLEKSCFGSAGCHVTFRIDPSYSGTQDATDLEVTYEILGGEDTAVNTFTIDSQGTASYDKEEFMSTPPGGELTARVVAVRRA